MWHATCMHVSQGDSWLLMIKSQIDILIFSPSFDHNLCYKYSNGSCKPILDIYVSRDFQWHIKLFNPMNFGLCNCFVKIWDSNSQNGSPFGNVWAHSLILPCSPKSASVTLELHF
jgi:hypothetical protein